MNILTRQLAENLRSHRAKHFLSKEQLGTELGVHRTCVGRIESGDENVSLATIDRIAERLGVHPAALLFDHGHPERVGPPGAGTSVISRQLALNLKAYRAKHGLSRDRLAERLVQNRSYVARIEAEETVTLAKVAELSAQLGLHPADLLDRKAEDPP